MGFLSKPIQVAGVMQEIPNARARFAEFEVIRAETSDVAEALAVQQLLEAAKAHLVGLGTAEPDTAFAALVASARESGTTLRAAAAHVIQSDGSPSP